MIHPTLWNSFLPKTIDFIFCWFWALQNSSGSLTYLFSSKCYPLFLFQFPCYYIEQSNPFFMYHLNYVKQHSWPLPAWVVPFPGSLSSLNHSSCSWFLVFSQTLPIVFVSLLLQVGYPEQVGAEAVCSTAWPWLPSLWNKISITAA